ncbi:MarR family winged helix-turn-helix transcriptional regulator [Solicola sp. PLA-1-18]|uniref:MarR family winged helix-turn-helix transcriptional regulator n=1 Tax=Solicola sp. PLA-1-18 TaxID=3380532 RepID=UPI003B76F437
MSEVRPGVDDEVLRALGDQIMRISRRRPTSYPGSELDGSAFKILWRLVNAGPRTLRELSDDLELDRSTINRQVSACLADGHVERFEEPGQVSRPVRATEAGTRAYRHDASLRADALRDALGRIGPDASATLIDAMRAFNDALDAAHARHD